MEIGHHYFLVKFRSRIQIGFYRNRKEPRHFIAVSPTSEMTGNCILYLRCSLACHWHTRRQCFVSTHLFLQIKSVIQRTCWDAGSDCQIYSIFDPLHFENHTLWCYCLVTHFSPWTFLYLSFQCCLLYIWPKLQLLGRKPDFTFKGLFQHLNQQPSYSILPCI